MKTTVYDDTRPSLFFRSRCAVGCFRFRLRVLLRFGYGVHSCASNSSQHLSIIMNLTPCQMI